MTTRRTTLLGLGALLSGGTSIASGAFDGTASVASDVRVLVVSDLRLEPGRDAARYVVTDENDRVTAINLDGTDATAAGINERARTRFEDLVSLTNNGDTTVQELYFEFAVDVGEHHDEALADRIAETLQVVAADDEIEATGDVDFLTVSESEDVEDGTLGSGDSVAFGIQVDLRPTDDPESLTSLRDLDYDITLHIRANMG